MRHCRRWERRSAGFLQHLLNSGSRGGSHRCARYAGVCLKGESLTDYWDYTPPIFEWPDNGYTNMILDDGGDATLLLHLGARAESDASLISKPTSEEETALYASIKAKLKTDPACTPRA